MREVFANESSYLRTTVNDVRWWKNCIFDFELQATSNINSVNLVFLVEIIYM